MKKAKRKASWKAKLLLACFPLFLVLLAEAVLWIFGVEPSWDFDVPVLAEKIQQVNFVEGDFHAALETQEYQLLRSNYALYDSDRTLFWKLKPDFSEEIYNFMSPLILNPTLLKKGLYEKAKFRAEVGPHRYALPEFVQRKEEGVFRLVCIGDSNTFGWGVNPDESYPRVLAGLLKEKLPDRKVEVINMGVPGYTSLQGRVLTEEQVEELEADLVIVAYGFNDRWSVARTDAEQLKRATGFTATLMYGLSQSRLLLWCRVFAQRFKSRPKEAKKNLTPEEIKALIAKLPKRVSPKEYGKNVDAICEKLQSRDVGVVFLDIFCVGDWGNAMRAVAKKRKITVIDGEKYLTDLLEEIRGDDPALEEYRRWAREQYTPLALETYPRLYLFNDNCHPNALGYRLLAGFVAEGVIRECFRGK